MDKTKIPCAPNAFNWRMISQKHPSSSTVCTDDHPSCANGITTVNIDNGFGAGYVATQINRLAERGHI